ncbi:MAG: hypothetical protein GY778_26720 [bacterium]|nr:hypothetical protein [bacterium]
MADQREHTITLPGFGPGPSEEISAAVNSAVESHMGLMVDLRSELERDGLADEGKVYAIYLAGELRAVPCVTDLVERIDFKAPFVDPKIAHGRWGMYPAQEALVKIGQPAVNMILDVLPDEADPARRDLMCRVLADVDGPDVAQFILERVHAAESDQRKERNLQAALSIAKKLPR